jgi:DNA repair exonuclease SbcCD ATPase subunit
MKKDDGREMYADLFEGVSPTSIQVPVLQEVANQARKLAEENGWSEEDAFQILFAHGLYYLLGEQRLQGSDGHEADAVAEVKRLTAELMDMQSKYAVMKFRAYTLNEAKQSLEFNLVGLETENRWSGERLKKFREDEELLKAKLSRVNEEIEQLRQRLAVLEGTAPPPLPRPGVVRRLLQRLRG